MKMYVNAISHYIPSIVVPNSYFKEVNGLDDEWIFTRTGIKARSKTEEGETTNTMALRAIENGISNYPFPIEEVDLIVAATYSPYDTVFTLAHQAQRHFNITNAKCVSVSSACSSFINAVEVVEGYFAMGKATKALILGAEHNTAYANETCSQSGHLWGDGAVAMLISNDKYSDNDAEVLSIFTKGLGHIGKADEAVHLHPQNGGISMPHGKDVFINACTYMVDALNEACSMAGKTLKDVNYISSHQANQRILSNISCQIDMPITNFLTNIEHRGNTGCPSCAISLSENIEKVQKGDLVALTVFGGGYSCGAMLLQY
ncbi:MAG: 3-oxoacyl-ACP synthase III family protein [Marinifilaceae bacterium]